MMITSVKCGIWPYSKYLLLMMLLLSAAASAESATKQTFMVAMRDGIKLATDVYRPPDGGPHPVLLYRTRYNKNSAPLISLIPLLNYKGYICAVQDTRGRFASQGVDSVFITDGWGALRDGYDTIEWLSKQIWCNGRVGMIGVSADGIITYRAAATLHPALTCAVAIVAATDFYHQVVYPGGEYRKELCENYLIQQNAAWMIGYYLQNPFYNELWQSMNWHSRSDSIRIPMMHIGGWYDCFSDGTIAAYQDLAQNPEAAPQQLIMGPWTHTTIGTNSNVGEMHYPDAGYDIYGLVIQWFDYYLLGRDTGAAMAPSARYYLLGDPERRSEGGCAWVEADSWPPADARVQDFYLAKDGMLTTQTGENGKLSFSYDPDHPVPTRGGNNLTIAAGPYDQSSLVARPDVLTFTTATLQQPLRVEGKVVGHFYVSSDAPDTDITLKLIDVFPDGRMMLVTDGIARLRFRYGDTAEKEALVQPGEIVSLSINLPPTAIVFNSGHRLMIAISSSNYDRFEINPNNGRAVNDRSERQMAVNTIYLGTSYPSRIAVPVVSSMTSLFPTSSMAESILMTAAYPNPFNQSTRIEFTSPQAGWVTAKVINLRGQVLRTIFQNWLPAGLHHALWDGRDDYGHQLCSGIYYLTIQMNASQRRMKLCLLR